MPPRVLSAQWFYSAAVASICSHSRSSVKKVVISKLMYPKHCFKTKEEREKCFYGEPIRALLNLIWPCEVQFYANHDLGCCRVWSKAPSKNKNLSYPNFLHALICFNMLSSWLGLTPSARKTQFKVQASDGVEKNHKNDYDVEARSGSCMIPGAFGFGPCTFWCLAPDMLEALQGAQIAFSWCSWVAVPSAPLSQHLLSLDERCGMHSLIRLGANRGSLSEDRVCRR